MRNLNENVAIRLHSSDKQLLLEVCEARGEYTSTFIRRLIRRELASLNYFSDEVKKAFSIEMK